MPAQGASALHVGTSAIRFGAGACWRRRRAFPIGELRTTTYIVALACLGGTVWLLDAPDRIWPWFPLGLAAWAAVALALIVSGDGVVGAIQAAVSLLIIGAAFYFAGERFAALGYGGLVWLCRAVIAVHVLGFAVRVLLACRPKPPRGVDSRIDKGDDSA